MSSVVLVSHQAAKEAKRSSILCLAQFNIPQRPLLMDPLKEQGQPQGR